MRFLRVKGPQNRPHRMSTPAVTVGVTVSHDIPRGALRHRQIGAVALRAIIGHPEFDLVGHYVSAPEKAGRDSGELVGRDPIGVTATNDWSDLVDLGADCLTYFGNSIGREADAIADLVPFLERGTNVVTFSGFAIAHPATTPPEFREPTGGGRADKATAAATSPASTQAGRQRIWRSHHWQWPTASTACE